VLAVQQPGELLEADITDHMRGDDIQIQTHRCGLLSVSSGSTAIPWTSPEAITATSLISDRVETLRLDLGSIR
jgi:hypothetical protein